MRINKGWSQDKLAEAMGIQQSRISKLELGQRPISEDEWLRLCHHLQSSGTLPKRRPLPYPEPSWRVRPPELFLQGDVPLSARVNRARKTFGSEVDRCLRVIRQRDDATLSFKFLNDACLDSGDEGMFWLLALAGGGRACWYPLSKAGFRQHRAVDASGNRSVSDLRLPCLEASREESSLLMFPQVRLDVRRAYYRLDALCCVRSGKRRCWVNLEIDGQGHDPEFDAQRQAHLDLPTVRLTRADLKRPDLLDEMERRLLKALDTATGEEESR